MPALRGHNWPQGLPGPPDTRPTPALKVRARHIVQQQVVLQVEQGSQPILQMRLDHPLQRKQAVNAAAAGHTGEDALARRREALAEIDRRGILATPANISINEFVTEAARVSIVEQGRAVRITCGVMRRVEG